MAVAVSLGHKLCTNDPLTVWEANTVREAFAMSSDKLRPIEQKIARLQERLESLSLRKRQRLDFIEGYRRLLSPVRRLLPEILQEVFCQCLPIAHNATMSTDEAPLLLGRVCRRWRQIAHSTPWLWSSIHFVAPWSGSFNEARRYAISMWVSRSETLPLSISMSSVDFGPQQPARDLVNDWLQPYLELIVPYMHRWKSIHLDIYYFDWISFFKRFEASDFPMLETLHLGTFPRQSEDEVYSITASPGILQAPRLRTLSLPGYISRLLHFSLRWEVLIGLDFSVGISPDDLNKALVLCPNLEVCSIAITLPDPPGVWQSHRIVGVTLPKLLTLVVKNINTRNEYISQLFESLSVPALRHLTYERTIFVWPQSPTGDFEPPGLSSSLSSFLRRLVYPLEELDLYISSDKILSDVLPLVPGLKRLALRGFGITHFPSSRGESTSFLRNHALALLTQDGSRNFDGSLTPNTGGSDDVGNDDGMAAPSYCCPNLQILQCHEASFSSDKIIEFLRARSINGQKYNATHLKRVYISFSARSLREGQEDEEDESTRNTILEFGQKTRMAVYLEYPPTPKPVKVAAGSSYSLFYGLTPNPPLDSGGPTYLEF